MDKKTIAFYATKLSLSGHMLHIKSQGLIFNQNLIFTLGFYVHIKQITNGYFY